MMKVGLKALAVFAVVAAVGCGGGGASVSQNTWTRSWGATPGSYPVGGTVDINFKADGTFTAAFSVAATSGGCTLAENYTGSYTSTTTATSGMVTTGTVTTTATAGTYAVTGCTDATMNIASRAATADESEVQNAAYTWSIDNTSSTAPTLALSGGCTGTGRCGFSGSYTKGAAAM